MAEDLNVNFAIRPEKAGLIETITIVPISEENPTGELKSLNHSRNFNVMGTLFSVPPLWNTHIVAGKLEGGETILNVNESEVQSYVMEGSGNQKFTVHLNQYKQLSSISAVIPANSWSFALKAFHNVVDPYLSMLSWKYQVPLVLSNVNGIDLETNYQYSKFIQPIPQVNFSISLDP